MTAWATRTLPTWQAEPAIAASEKELALAHSDSTLTADQKKQFAELARKRIAAMKH